MSLYFSHKDKMFQRLQSKNADSILEMHTLLIGCLVSEMTHHTDVLQVIGLIVAAVEVGIHQSHVVIHETVQQHQSERLKVYD